MLGSREPEMRLDIKRLSYQYENSHYKDETVYGHFIFITGILLLWKPVFILKRYLIVCIPFQFVSTGTTLVVYHLFM